MHPQLNVPLDSDPCLQVVVTFNKAIGDCLEHAILTAKDFDDACLRLLNCDWPTTAPRKTTPYLPQFPELSRLFTTRGPNEPLPKGTIWDEVPLALLLHADYQQLVRIRSHRYRYLLKQRGLEMMDLYVECLPRSTRQIIGRAAVWPVTLVPYRAKYPQTTWLQWALNWSRKEVDRAIRHKLGLPVRDRNRQDQEPHRSMANIPKSGRDYKCPNEIPLSGQEESRELPPEVLAEARERQRIVREALEKLSTEQRQLIDLKQERTFDEIAQQLGWHESTVRTRYRQALEVLRRQLGRVFGPEKETPQR